MKCITGKYGWLLAFSCWLLATGCSSDSAGDQHQSAGSPLQVAPYISAYQHSGASSRRAVSTGYSAYTPDHDISIGLYVLPEGTTTATNDDVKLIRYSNGDWHSQAIVEGNHQYSIYGYMPKSITSAISVNAGNVVLTLTGIPAVMADDVCIVTGVKDGKIGEAGNLYQGAFGYAGKSNNNYLCLLMDHLFAAVNLNFTVDPDYSALRIIKLKKMELSTTMASMNATVTLTPNSTDSDPVTFVNYTSTNGTSSAVFFESTTGVEINAANAEMLRGYFSCFAPELSNNLTLVSTYDVYDRKGNKIQENRTASNKLPNLNAVRGQRVTINLNIAPTYLGVLSDPDVDNPTITVN